MRRYDEERAEALPEALPAVLPVVLPAPPVAAPLPVVPVALPVLPVPGRVAPLAIEPDGVTFVNMKPPLACVLEDAAPPVVDDVLPVVAPPAPPLACRHPVNVIVC